MCVYVCVCGYLRPDGVFLMRLIGHNTNTITVTEVRHFLSGCLVPCSFRVHSGVGVSVKGSLWEEEGVSVKGVSMKSGVSVKGNGDPLPLLFSHREAENLPSLLLPTNKVEGMCHSFCPQQGGGC